MTSMASGTTFRTSVTTSMPRQGLHALRQDRHDLHPSGPLFFLHHGSQVLYHNLHGHHRLHDLCRSLHVVRRDFLIPVKTSIALPQPRIADDSAQEDVHPYRGVLYHYIIMSCCWVPLQSQPTKFSCLRERGWGGGGRGGPSPPRHVQGHPDPQQHLGSPSTYIYEHTANKANKYYNGGGGGQ
jgi:hypothetical protein